MFIFVLIYLINDTAHFPKARINLLNTQYCFDLQIFGCGIYGIYLCGSFRFLYLLPYFDWLVSLNRDTEYSRGVSNLCESLIFLLHIKIFYDADKSVLSA